MNYFSKNQNKKSMVSYDVLSQSVKIISMKFIIFYLTIISVCNVFAQDGKIIERKIFQLSKSDQAKI